LIVLGDGAGAFEAGFMTAAGIGGDAGDPVNGTAIDLNEDGAADLVLPDRFTSRITVLLSDPLAGTLPARAFPSKPGPVQIGGGGPPYTCVSVEPLAGAYENSDVNLRSLSMTSPGTGDVDVIYAKPTQTQIVGDTDGDGIAEIEACFSRDDLRRLFNGLDGKTTVSVTVDGALKTGRPLRAPLRLRLKSSEAHKASVYPSPSNPAATLTFETKGIGPVRVRLFDIRGRFVRTILEDPRFDTGIHSIRVDGLDDAGSPLSAGVYFYRIESPQRVERGRLTILK
jgi:hypothetical protein